MKKLTKAEIKQIAKFTAKIDEWVTRGTEMKKIRKCLSDYYGVMSDERGGYTRFAISRSVSDGRGGRMHKGQYVFKVVELA